MMDLTTLEGADTPGKVRDVREASSRIRSSRLSGPRRRLRLPDPVPVARRALGGSAVKVASVATAFPSGQCRST